MPRIKSIELIVNVGVCLSKGFVMQGKCEECGIKLGNNTYRRDIHGVQHSFCCSHCAGSYEKRTKGHLHH